MAGILPIMAAGNSPKASIAIVGGNLSEGTQVAAGTTKATSAVLLGYKNYISITSSTKGVSFIGGTVQGDDIEVFNGGTNALSVYTTIGAAETITTLSANAGFQVSAAKGAKFTKVTNTLWMVNYSR